jgi:hypothetical protein
MRLLPSLATGTQRRWSIVNARVAGGTLVIMCLAGMCVATAPAARGAEVIVEGNLSKIVDEIVRRGYGKKRLVISSRLNLDGQSITTHFGVSDSALSDQVVYRDNCIASPADHVIDCDLKLIDDLIHEFYLDKIFGAGNGSRRLRFFRRNLMLWVIAHEIGHIALKHGLSDFEDPNHGMSLFDAARQKYELAADAYAIRLVGNLDVAPAAPYSAILDVTNALMRKSVCPETFPEVCDRMPRGVGLIFDYSANAKPVLIPAGGTHPAFIARFLRILYLSGIGTTENSINYEARQAIDLLEIQGDSGTRMSLRHAIQDPQVQ